MNMNGAVRKLNPGGRELVEVDSRNRLPVYFEEDAVAGEDSGQDTAFAVSGNHLVHGECDGFQTSKTANLHYDCGLRRIDPGGAV